MSKSTSRGPADTGTAADLRLPRPPGALRRFGMAHPLIADGILAFLALASSSVLVSRDPAVEIAPTVALVVGLLLLISCGALLLRRRLPVAVFALSLLAQASFLIGSLPAALPLLLVTSYSVAVYRSNRIALASLAAGGALLAGAAMTALWTGLADQTASLSNAIGGGVLLIVGTLVGVNVGTRRRYQESLIERSRQLAVERDQQAQLAAAGERARIARELHDIVAHSLTVMIALSEGASATSDLGRAHAANEAIASTGRAALDQMRSTLGVLRGDDMTAPLAAAGGEEGLDAIEAARAVGFDAEISVSGRPVENPVIRLAVARILQEAVTNAMRHADGATAIRAAIDYREDVVVIDITDDGRGKGADRGNGFGLRGLAERASLAGGSLQAGPLPEGGWRVHAELPTSGAGGDRHA